MSLAERQPSKTAAPIEALRAIPILAYPIAAAVTATTLDGGGFSPGSQTILIVLAAIALLVAAFYDADALAVIARSPVAMILLLLGGLAALSSLWTIGQPSESLRWGLVILAYGAIVLSTGVLATRTGPWPIAAGIAGLAAIEAALGLGAAALHALPDAELVAGSWRPGGTFQYSPTLGLLEVAALPALLGALGHQRRFVALAGALALALDGAVLGCADSRLDLALVAVVLVMSVGWPPSYVRDRVEIFAAAVLVVLAALAGHLLLGQHVTSADNTGGPLRLAAMGSLCVALALLWRPIRTLLRKRVRLSARTLVLAAVVVIAGAIIAWVAIGYSGTLGSFRGGIGHGRIHYWSVAVKTWLHRPLIGSGANTFYQASVRYQGIGDVTRFAHNLPLELAVELGVLGLLLGAALYGAAVRSVKRAWASPSVWLLAPMVVAFLIANLVDWPWHLAGLGATWAAAAGGLAAGAAHQPLSASAASHLDRWGRYSRSESADLIVSDSTQT